MFLSEEVDIELSESNDSIQISTQADVMRSMPLLVWEENSQREDQDQNKENTREEGDRWKFVKLRHLDQIVMTWKIFFLVMCNNVPGVPEKNFRLYAGLPSCNWFNK